MVSFRCFAGAYFIGAFLLVGCQENPVSLGEPQSSPLVVSKKSSFSREWLVSYVVDGDTVIVKKPTKGSPKRTWPTETIRLLRINTPEKDQPGYGEAKKALQQLVAQKRVSLEFENPRIAKRGNYGRLLAYVFADNVNVNVEMVRQGWSKFWTKYGAGKYQHQFEIAQGQAMGKKRGLFGELGL